MYYKNKDTSNTCTEFLNLEDSNHAGYKLHERQTVCLMWTAPSWKTTRQFPYGIYWGLQEGGNCRNFNFQCMTYNFTANCKSLLCNLDLHPSDAV